MDKYGILIMGGDTMSEDEVRKIFTKNLNYFFIS